MDYYNYPKYIYTDNMKLKEFSLNQFKCEVLNVLMFGK